MVEKSGKAYKETNVTFSGRNMLWALNHLEIFHRLFLHGSDIPDLLYVSDLKRILII